RVEGDAGARARAALSELEAGREKVARAAGDAVALEGALGELEETFERLTGTGATRRQGLVYAGRTLVYEDCVRDLELSIGADAMRSRFGLALAQVLVSARWYTYEVATRYRAALDRIYDQLSREAGAVIEYLAFY